MAAKAAGIRVAVAAVLVGIVTPAHAGTDYFKGGADPTEIKYREENSRTTKQKLTIAGLGVGGLLVGAIGLHYHLDSRDAAEELSVDDDIVGTWTADRQALDDQAESSGIKAIVGYTVGALLLGGAVVVMWKTSPGERVVTVAPRARLVTPVVEPVAGGAVVGGAWAW